MKATTLLKKQHREVKALFAVLKKHPKNASAVAQEIVKSLLCHMLIEEETFYPAVKELDEDLVLEAYEEHATARFTMRRLLASSSNDESFDARGTTLKELIEHHVEEEEEFFAKVEKKMKADELNELGETMKAQFEASQAQPVETLFTRVERLAPKPERAAA